MAKRKFDITKDGRDRFVKKNLHGSSGCFGKPVKFGIITAYIDRYERTFSLSDGDIILSISLDKVIDILNESGET